jgi:PAS domain S-box-containing protein
VPRHVRRVTAAALAGGLPAVAAAWWLARAAGGRPAAYAVAAAATAAWLIGTAVLRERVERPLQTLANMLAALREGDFTMRGRAARPDDAMGLALTEANLLTATLREERLRALESAALLRRVLGEIDAALFAFDDGGRLRLVNRAGERLLGRPAERALGETAAALGLAGLADRPDADGAAADAAPRVVAATFPGGSGRWEVRAGEFRQGGRPHRLLLVTDVSETLRAEERAAWQRLVRVLSHEINNSLAPIKTIAGSLGRRVRRAAASAGAGGDGAVALGVPGALGASGATAGVDFERGLATIAERADALARFVGAYARLSRLPPPARRPMPVETWVRRVAALEPRVPVVVLGGPAAGPGARLDADPDQLDQLLINLVRNAADAVLSRPAGDGDREPPAVRLAWGPADAEAGGGARVRVTVDDDGRGWRAPPTCSCPSTAPSPTAAASAWPSPGRSPRRTAAPSRSRTATRPRASRPARRRAAGPRCSSRRPAPPAGDGPAAPGRRPRPAPARARRSPAGHDGV